MDHEAIVHGVEVIVTDHHSCLKPRQMLMLLSILNIQMRLSFKYLAGCGATSWLVPVEEVRFDLVAIGIIADMVSLTDENRI